MPNPASDTWRDVAGLAASRHILARAAAWPAEPTPPDLYDWLVLLAWLRLPDCLSGAPANPDPRIDFAPLWVIAARERDLLAVRDSQVPVAIRPAGLKLLQRHAPLAALIGASLDWLAARLPSGNSERLNAYTDLARLWCHLRQSGATPPAGLDAAFASAHPLPNTELEYSNSEICDIDPHDAACWTILHRLHAEFGPWLKHQLAFMGQAAAAARTAPPRT